MKNNYKIMQNIFVLQILCHKNITQDTNNDENKYFINTLILLNLLRINEKQRLHSKFLKYNHNRSNFYYTFIFLISEFLNY